MLRLAKLTDYAIVILAHLTREAHVCVHPAGAIADATRIPQPTVEKVLKLLGRGGIVVSSRGVRGGYSLGRPPEAISVVDVIIAIEGPVGLTECSHPDGSPCADEPTCPVSHHWPAVDRAVRGALGSVTILELSRPATARGAGAETHVPPTAGAAYPPHAVAMRKEGP